MYVEFNSFSKLTLITEWDCFKGGKESWVPQYS